MGGKKKNSNPLDYLNLPEINLDEKAKRSILVVLLVVFGLISLLGLFNLSGHFGEFIAKWLTLIFGFGKYLVPLIFIYWAVIISRKEKKSLQFTDYLGLGLLFISYQTLFHFLRCQCVGEQSRGWCWWWFCWSIFK